MSQPTANPLERWFIQHDSKLPIFGLDSETAKLLAELKDTNSVGIVVKLPDTIGYTEIILSIESIPLSQSNQAYQAQLNIQQTVNLVLPEFEQGIIPTVSELQELLEEAIDAFTINNYAIVTF